MGGRGAQGGGVKKGREGRRACCVMLRVHQVRFLCARAWHAAMRMHVWRCVKQLKRLACPGLTRGSSQEALQGRLTGRGADELGWARQRAAAPTRCPCPHARHLAPMRAAPSPLRPCAAQGGHLRLLTPHVP